LNARPLLTIYLRRSGDHAYAVAIQAVTRPANADQFCARLVNMVRLGPGQTVSVRADLQPEYGATRDEAFSRIEAAIEKWRTAPALLLGQPARQEAPSPHWRDVVIAQTGTIRLRLPNMPDPPSFAGRPYSRDFRRDGSAFVRGEASQPRASARPSLDPTGKPL
jgi:hypothetical protein